MGSETKSIARSCCFFGVFVDILLFFAAGTVAI